MNSLTPFIHHALPNRPGPSSAPEANCSRCSPPLGKQPDPTLQHTHSAHPAPDEDADAVQQLVEWRENAPYG